jgi:hypothetical protein
MHEWWQRGTIYQIYPRSFMDSNGDGVGDLQGIVSKLSYLEWLGVDAVWLLPIYPSPMADFGYDITDFMGIDPIFGTLDDFNALVAAVHARRLKLILDFVPSHTSNEHPWFLASKRAVRILGVTGTSGAIRGLAAARRTTGAVCSAAARGNSTPRPDSTTITRISRSSQT